MTEVKNRPIRKLRVGNVTGAVWKNEFPGKDGKMIQSESLQINKIFKDKNDQWKTTDSYNKNEVQRVITLCQAYLHSQVVEDDSKPSAEESA